jgi:hypothetical protein
LFAVQVSPDKLLALGRASVVHFLIAFGRTKAEALATATARERDRPGVINTRR